MSQWREADEPTGRGGSGDRPDRQWPADDIVDVGSGGVNPELNRMFPDIGGDAGSADADRTRVEESEDVPFDVQVTDALSMLADGGHDYGSHPVASPDEETEVEETIIDESSKDA